MLKPSLWPPVKDKSPLNCTCFPRVKQREQPTCLLFKAPQEVRFMIYKLVLQASDRIVISINDAERMKNFRDWKIKGDLNTISTAIQRKQLTTCLLQCCKAFCSEATQILYGSNQFVFEDSSSITAFRKSGLQKHTRENDAYILALDPSISAGRFHYVTNFTFKPRNLPDYSPEIWNRFSTNIARWPSNRHQFPGLRVLNIDLRGLKHPSYRHLDVEDIIEALSDLVMIRLQGVNLIPVRLVGALQGVRSSAEEITEAHSKISAKEGHYEMHDEDIEKVGVFEFWREKHDEKS